MLLLFSLSEAGEKSRIERLEEAIITINEILQKLSASLPTPEKAGDPGSQVEEQAQSEEDFALSSTASQQISEDSGSDDAKELVELES